MHQPYVDQLNPVAFSLGPIQVHWYGLMYLLSFLGVWLLGEYRRRRGRLPVTAEALGDLAFYAMLGVIIGGRVWYMLFYYVGGVAWIWTDPPALFRVWDGGMSFHGGLIGVVLALCWWSRKHRMHPFDVVDFVAPLVPVGLFLGRFGNFINGELWGKPSDAAWAMIFPNAHAEDVQLAASNPHWQTLLQQFGGLPRHPSQLYEMALEGVVMFAVLWLMSMKPQPRYRIAGLFGLLYGCFRLLIEFVRVPDSQLGCATQCAPGMQPGYLFGTQWVTMGQMQSLPLIAIGLVLIVMSRHAPTLAPVSPKES